MKLTIFNTYVPMVDQVQCDRMKQLCIDNGLPIWDDFRFETKAKDFYKFFYRDIEDFCNWKENSHDFEKVTEQQFIELLKEYKLNN